MTYPLREEKFEMGERTLFLIVNLRITNLFLVCMVLVLLLPVSSPCKTDSLESRIELKSYVDRSGVPFNHQLTFTVEASWEGEQDRFSITPVAPPRCEKLEILGSSSLNEIRREEGGAKSVKIFKFTLKPTETGPGKVGSIKLSYVDNVTQDTSSLSTQPVSVQITPPVRERGPDYKTVLLVAIILIFAYVLYSAIRRRQRIEIATNEEAEMPLSEEESPEDETLKELEAISQRIQQGELRRFSSDVYRTLTAYLERRYQVVTSGKTTDDIMGSLSRLNLPSERIATLKNVLSACDLIKFARETPEKGRCEKIMGQAREFVEQNR
jgi:cbb3-type cytochrome oxidase subunit 3